MTQPAVSQSTANLKLASVLLGDDDFYRKVRVPQDGNTNISAAETIKAIERAFKKREFGDFALRVIIDSGRDPVTVLINAEKAFDFHVPYDIWRDLSLRCFGPKKVIDNISGVGQLLQKLHGSRSRGVPYVLFENILDDLMTSLRSVPTRISEINNLGLLIKSIPPKVFTRDELINELITMYMDQLWSDRTILRRCEDPVALIDSLYESGHIDEAQMVSSVFAEQLRLSPESFLETLENAKHLVTVFEKLRQERDLEKVSEAVIDTMVDVINEINEQQPILLASYESLRQIPLSNGREQLSLDKCLSRFGIKSVDPFTLTRT